MRAPLTGLAAAVAVLVFCCFCPCGTAGAGKPDPPAADDPPTVIDPMGPNAACYVCHVTFVHEQLSKVHLAAKVGCIKCHGLSAKHANNENVGATKPDIVYRRGQIDKMCVECHKDHKVDAKKVIARFIERKLHGTSIVCTQCHGTHEIDRAAQAAQIAGKTGPAPAPQ